MHPSMEVLVCLSRDEKEKRTYFYSLSCTRADMRAHRMGLMMCSQHHA